MATAPSRDASLPGGALRRHSPKLGAQCGNSARWDLCGGAPARAVPTATATCAPSTRPRPGSRSSATTSARTTTRRDGRVGAWATANNAEIAYTPTNSSWLNRVEAQFTALRYFTLDGTDHASHTEQATMIRRYIIWRNNHAYEYLGRDQTCDLQELQVAPLTVPLCPGGLTSTTWRN